MLAGAAVLMAVGLRREHMREVERELAASADRRHVGEPA